MKSTGSKFDKIIADSSDEESIKQENEEYDLKTSISDNRFNSDAENLGVEVNTLKKSFLMHSIGRMAIYNPRIDKKYRDHKEDLLRTNKSSGSVKLDSDSQINTQELGIKVENIEDLIALGRLMRRSQVRSHKIIKRDRSFKKSTVTRATINFTSNNEITGHHVVEDLVLSYGGIGRGGKVMPNTDMVDLQLSSDKGDYNSAYEGNKYNRGASSINNVAAASETTAADNNLAKGDSERLEEVARTLSRLNTAVSKNFKKENNDAFIADCIRKVCKGEPLFELADPKNEGIKNQVYSLTYLLFKTEVYRSPAALISNIQMLELVIGGQMSLADAFGEKKEMPMSMVGAIKGARFLESVFNNDAFYQYENPYDYFIPKNPIEEREFHENKIQLTKQLITSETNLTDKWMQFRFGEEKSHEMKDNIQDFLPEIHEEICGSLQNFGVKLNSLASLKVIAPELYKNSHTDNPPSNSPESPSAKTTGGKRERD